MKKRPYKIVLTGGPCAGKTSVIKKLQERYFNNMIYVPELATALMKTNVFEAPLKNNKLHKPSQDFFEKGIYYCQKNSEDFYTAMYEDKNVMILDRGTLDGAAYCETVDYFFDLVNTDYEKELSNYDLVIHMQTAAFKDSFSNENNEFRYEDPHTAIELDKKIKDVWKKHKDFHYIEATDCKTEKIDKVLDIIEEKLIDKLSIN